MSWYLGVWRKYAVFEGRASRSEYWIFALFNAIALVVLSLADTLLGTLSKDSGLGLLSGAYLIAATVPQLAVAVRRLHDVGTSGIWLLAALVPVLGGILLFVLLISAGDKNENRYGPSPLPQREPPPEAADGGPPFTVAEGRFAACPWCGRKNPSGRSNCQWCHKPYRQESA